MRIILKQMVWIILIALVIANIYIFIRGMRLANDISYFENQIREIHQKNLELEKKLSSIDSYQYASSLAAKLKFSKKTTPTHLDNLKYALNR